MILIHATGHQALFCLKDATVNASLQPAAAVGEKTKKLQISR
jgi:hypothetical protein